MSTIAILGSGRVGTTLATALIGSGRDVVLGVRDPARVRADWTGPTVRIVDVREAIDRAGIVINATPGDSSLARFTALQEALAGKILVDVSNATARGGDGLPGGLVHSESSLGELLQAALPRTAVVKTLNTMLYSAMTAPASLGSPPTVFLSGDDAEAKARVRELLTDLGWTGAGMLDLGGIASARGTEAIALLVPSLLGVLGFAPFAVSIAR
ncbi:NADPH-dependent F420 reductase [Herbiconiux sp. 11R-BC]|uniref:NADPH-dependent F420 reductase n=1 Tax=Herbiconiux sp. 11R-BC TaxID=3111637 RepID=UPI003C2F1352